MTTEKKTIIKLVLMCAFGLFLSASLLADVYVLWPFSPPKDTKPVQGGAQNDLPAAAPVRPKKFWQEDVIVNGNKLRLNIYLLEGKWDEIAAHAKKTAVKGSAIMGNSSSLFIQNPPENGLIQRTYYLHLSGEYPMLMFQMSLPENRLNMAKKQWPQEFPLLNNATNLNCMQFPARNALYGSYDVTTMNKNQALSTVSATIALAGWVPVSGESRMQHEGSGEVFYKEKPSRVLILGLQEIPGGKGTRISLYTRQL